MRKLVFTCVLLLLLTNILVLAGVAYNRSGEPLYSLVLTERELPFFQPFRNKDENSGTTLSLLWQIDDPDKEPQYRSTPNGSPDWLDHEKLTELGFDIKKFKSDKDKYRQRTRYLANEVILVLEYQGDSYYGAMARTDKKFNELRQRAKNHPEDKALINTLSKYELMLTRLKVSRTRLDVIDAALDKQTLMKKYAERNNILLVRGEIGLHWTNNVVSGHIRHLYVQQVHVPLPFSAQLAAWTNGETNLNYGDSSMSPRYKVRLNIGNRLEPWIESVAQMESR